ncbi:hypothetical protein BIW11_08810 [Tropilaelaps mercedesae]|uniref:Uncharacterized protein n=1 Tax=Tropilaelaps mercedesae TaxID=418985 RepID=A0A1V9XN47_9ACAR|nr:hypothetical protein BIW11_08810 [Tropilaelaps mercedesae]
MVMLLSELPQGNPQVGCVSLDCDFGLLLKQLRQRRQLDRTQSYFLALLSCGKIQAELYDPSAAQSAAAWMESFIKALGPDAKLSVRIHRNKVLARLDN